MSSLNSVIKTLIKFNVATALVSLVAMLVIRSQQAQQNYNTQVATTVSYPYHRLVKEKPQEDGYSKGINTKQLAEKVQKLEGELQQTKKKVTSLTAGNQVETQDHQHGNKINVISRVPTNLSISREYKIGTTGSSPQLIEGQTAEPKQIVVKAENKNITSSRVRSNSLEVSQQESRRAASTKVLKTQEIAQANHLEQQRVGLSKSQSVALKTTPNGGNPSSMLDQQVTPLPVQPLAGNENGVLISMTKAGAAVSSSVIDTKEGISAQELSLNEEAKYLYGNPNITLSSSDINHSRLGSPTEKSASIRMANDIAYGLIIAAEKGHINYGTKAYRRVQTAIRVLRRGENFYDAARIAEVPSDLLRQLVRWGENRPGSLAAMIEVNPDNMDLR
ncbi:MAG: hypothetical protein N5P05_002469 [Chroococcopsis gigantea SAG 12.99]|jgi:predicted transcriptional regulator|nr:hypothetical protein [Chroococcopsis gigantea SAG 12.99]